MPKPRPGWACRDRRSDHLKSSQYAWNRASGLPTPKGSALAPPHSKIEKERKANEKSAKMGRSTDVGLDRRSSIRV
jgi:hypothetical protein